MIRKVKVTQSQEKFRQLWRVNTLSTSAFSSLYETMLAMQQTYSDTMQNQQWFTITRTYWRSVIERLFYGLLWTTTTPLFVNWKSKPWKITAVVLSQGRSCFQLFIDLTAFPTPYDPNPWMAATQCSRMLASSLPRSWWTHRPIQPSSEWTSWSVQRKHGRTWNQI